MHLCNHPLQGRVAGLRAMQLDLDNKPPTPIRGHVMRAPSELDTLSLSLSNFNLNLEAGMGMGQAGSQGASFMPRTGSLQPSSQPGPGLCSLMKLASCHI